MDRPSIHYPPIFDTFVTKEYYFFVIQMIELWHWLSNSLFHINGTKYFCPCYKKHLEWGWWWCNEEIFSDYTVLYKINFFRSKAFLIPTRGSECLNSNLMKLAANSNWLHSRFNGAESKWFIVKAWTRNLLSQSPNEAWLLLQTKSRPPKKKTLKRSKRGFFYCFTISNGRTLNCFISK